ncbi:MAG: hypothetical protein HY511_05570 [Actinobacteria bacterium]|nr:hypothetical protein [Actinomycetota bacterium]
MSVPKRGKQPNGTWAGSSRQINTPSIEAAIQHAWNKAKRGHEGELRLQVEAIYVIGTNPITEYRVVLGPP